MTGVEGAAKLAEVLRKNSTLEKLNLLSKMMSLLLRLSAFCLVYVNFSLSTAQILDNTSLL
jgi:hypothetical protein